MLGNLGEFKQINIGSCYQSRPSQCVYIYYSIGFCNRITYYII